MDKNDKKSELIEALKVMSNWLLNYTPEYLDIEVLLDDFCHNLVKYRIPLWRVSLNVHTSHSDVFVRNIIWTESEGCRSEHVHHIDLSSEVFLKSPVAKIYHRSGPIRRKLIGPKAKLDFPVCEEVAKSGGTDYLIAPLKFTNGTISFISFTTKHGDGFAEEHICFFEEIIAYLTMRIELESSYFSCNSMLSRFVGRFASTKIENGEVQTGRTEEIEAAVFYCRIDALKKIGHEKNTQQTVDLINQYHDIIYKEVSGRGGDVVHFTQEGVLAIFEIGLVSKKAVFNNVLSCVKGVFSKVHAKDGNDLGLQVLINVGKLIQANIGCRDRIDFSLLGLPIRETIEVASKIVSISSEALVSRAFKDQSGIEISSDATFDFFSIDGITT